MNPGELALLGSITIAGFGFAGLAVWLGITRGRLDGDLRVATADVDRLRAELTASTEALAAANRRHEQAKRDHRRTMEDLYATIRESGGPAAIGDVVVSELERLLSGETDADGDPRGDPTLPR